MIVKPGYGNERLHLRESIDHLRVSFGAPGEKRDVSPMRQYWLYPNCHFECLVSRKTGAVLSIFLRHSNPIGGEDLFGLTEPEIRNRFSTPDEEGGGLDTEAGYFGRWLSYNGGIGFHFDKRGQVEVVSLFRRKRASQKAPSMKAAVHQDQRLGMAALRL